VLSWSASNALVPGNLSHSTLTGKLTDALAHRCPSCYNYCLSPSGLIYDSPQV